MAFPTTYYLVSTTGEKLTITGALIRTVTPRLFFFGKHHKFGLNANEVGGGMGGVYATGVVDAGTPANSFALTADDYHTATPAAGSVLGKHDAYAQIDPRHTAVKLDVVEFWDAVTPGFACTASVATTSGSATVTVGDTRLFTVGQGITATGVPSGARIAGIVHTGGTPAASTQLILTHQATATATVEGTFTGGNLLGAMLRRDIRMEGAAISMLS